MFRKVCGSDFDVGSGELIGVFNGEDSGTTSDPIQHSLYMYEQNRNFSDSIFENGFGQISLNFILTGRMFFREKTMGTDIADW